MKLPDLKPVYTAVFAIFAMCWLVDAGAHHSFSRFDASRMVEVEGELLSFSWRNPHIRFRIREINEAGDEVIWDLEGHSVSILRRTNASPEGLKTGDRIRIAGWPTVRSSTEIFVHNLMTSDGREIVFGAPAKPRWSKDDVILIRMEEYDTVRTVHMNLASAPLDLQRSLLGFSTGHWDNDILVVTTAGVDFAYFDPNGTPQGSDPSFIERFRVNDDGSRLLYELTATDDEVFTESVTVTKDWVWRPGEQVRPYECEQW